LYSFFAFSCRAFCSKLFLLFWQSLSYILSLYYAKPTNWLPTMMILSRQQNTKWTDRAATFFVPVPCPKRWSGAESTLPSMCISFFSYLFPLKFMFFFENMRAWQKTVQLCIHHHPKWLVPKSTLNKFLKRSRIWISIEELRSWKILNYWGEIMWFFKMLFYEKFKKYLKELKYT
jgi:hypothetical protein